MKKLIALFVCALLVMAATPVLAFTGYDEEPEYPVMTFSPEPFFDIEIVRMENEPAIEETPWGETYTVWNPMGSDPAADIGETVTYAIEYTVPDTIEGFTDEELNQITLAVAFEGIEGVEIVDATGLELNIGCNFEYGYCYLLPGYSNAWVEDEIVMIEPKLSTEVQVIVSGVVSDTEAECMFAQIVGQASLPTHYSVGKVTPIEGGYFVNLKDIYALQYRGMKFFTLDGVFDHYYVCLNEIDYIRSADSKGVSYTSVEDPSVVITEGERFDGLERAYNDIMGFFGFTDDGKADVMTDPVFLQGPEPEAYFGSVGLFGSGDEPGDPAPIAPPVTGGASIAIIGVIAVACGAAVLFLRKRED